MSAAVAMLADVDVADHAAAGPVLSTSATTKVQASEFQMPSKKCYGGVRSGHAASTSCDGGAPIQGPGWESPLLQGSMNLAQAN